MSTTAPPAPKKSRRTENATLKGAGAIAQGMKAKAARVRGVVVDGPVGGNITTGDTTYQTIIHQNSTRNRWMCYWTSGRD